VTDDENNPSEQERAEAEALARAIEGDAGGSAPGDVVETATLLRAVAAKEGLSSERARAVYSGLEPAIEHYVRPRSSGTLITLAALGACLAAAAALVLYVSRPESPAAVAAIHDHGPIRKVSMPSPSRELLAAQAALGTEDASDATRAAFEREMRVYRASVLRALKNEYPAEVGMLHPARPR
jgi:hypothetical protein